MKRKLIILNVTLVAAMAFAGVQLRKEWKAAKQRESAARNPRVTPPAVPALPPIPQEPPVTPSKYADVAQKTLLHPERNPNVAVEPPPAPPPPPPPPPQPPLPVFHGTMSLGSGPIAILSVNAGAPHQATRIGEQIGPYKLTDIFADGVTLEWNGQTFQKKVEELSKRAEAAPAAAGPAADSRTPNAAPVPEKPAEPVKAGPGVETPYGIRVCSMQDGLAEGTVMEGYKKVVYTSPFGKSCGWEKVK